MATEQRRQAASWYRSRSGPVLLAFLVIAGFFVVTEHTAHLLGVLPYLLLLACPLLHFFHRRQGKGHDGHEGGDQPPETGEDR